MLTYTEWAWAIEKKPLQFEYLKFWPIWKVIMQISKSQQSLYHIFEDICWGF